MSETSKEELVELLRPFGQEHLLAFWNELDAGERIGLAEQIRRVDFARLERLYRQGGSTINWGALARRAQSPPAFRLGSSKNQFSPAEARARGAEALGSGKVATLLVAGGQGTRLGFDHPKGLYPIGPVSQATLFQILLEKVLAVGRRYGAPTRLCLMTSPATHDETVEFLEKHERFGLPADWLHLFCQGTMPAVDERTGKVLLAEMGRLFASPDGHGGMLAALDSSGGLDALRAAGIEQVFYFQVDNPLCQVCNEEFLGYHLLARSELSTQVVRKQFPTEKVGNVASIDGRLRIIEYSDLPEDAAKRRRPDGSLELWAGNTAVHIFDVAFLERVKADQEALPFHLAHKQVAYLDPGGGHIDPAKPNAIKFERFIFDLLPAAERAIVVEVDAAEHFAPLKNGPGSQRDSPETVKRQMVALYRRWLEMAGAKLAKNIDVEISPLFALEPAELKEKLILTRTIDEPTYFS